MHLLGVVSENFESTRYVDTVETVQTDSGTDRTVIHKVSNFAVYVELAPLSPWLDGLAGGELG